MLNKALTEIFWVLLLMFLFGSIALLLSGCNYEGAGFTNNGAYNKQLCRYIDQRGNERWTTAPASGRCY